MRTMTRKKARKIQATTPLDSLRKMIINDALLLGETYDPEQALFILPDGRMINGVVDGTRRDHSEVPVTERIATILSMIKKPKPGDNLIKEMYHAIGNIIDFYFDGKQMVLRFYNKPTPEQKNIIEDILKTYPVQFIYADAYYWDGEEFKQGFTGEFYPEQIKELWEKLEELY